MPSIADTIEIAELSLSMARVDVDKSSFRGPVLDYLLPMKIMILKKGVKWAYEQSATYENLGETANFLYAMLDKYGILATNAINLSSPVDGGPVIEIVGEVSDFPIYITQDAFTTATFYPDTRLYGNSLRIHFNQLNRFLSDGEYTVDATGLTVTLAGFDATDPENLYEITIWKING